MATIQPFKMLTDKEREELLKELNYHQKKESVHEEIKVSEPVRKIKKRPDTSCHDIYINNTVDNPFKGFCRKAADFIKDNVDISIGVGSRDGSVDKSFGIGDIKDIITGDKELKTNISIGPLDLDIGVTDILRGIDYLGGGFKVF